VQIKRIDEFHTRLKTPLLPFYLIHGDEPLLIQECADALRGACRAQGIEDRQIFNVDAGFDWNRLVGEFGSMSLFGERKLIEVRLAGAKLGPAGSQTLRELAALPPSEDVMLILAGKLDRDVEKSAWVRAIEEAGATLRVWPLRRNELPGWITQRLRAAGFQPTRDAVALLQASVRTPFAHMDAEALLPAVKRLQGRTAASDWLGTLLMAEQNATAKKRLGELQGTL